MSRIVPLALLLVALSGEARGQGYCRYGEMMSITDQLAAWMGQKSIADDYERCMITQQELQLMEQQLELARECGDPVMIIRSQGIVRQGRSAVVSACGDLQ
ncbi:hypothetical protein [Sinorhizobium meliloti]|uniref:Uncharacterized protein n=1 Tax=Rhizobium meliloti TaxID=382 RepID=A0AAW9U6R3_RHIML|nr:hypothetical protein [Sinorhizobium meliloti]MQW38189.1 hypothetical protein [Sinorhizobium meliloti]